MSKPTGWLAVFPALIALTVCSSASAQTTQSRVLVHAGKLLDVKTGHIATDQVIVIEGDKIVSVGPAGSVKSSPGKWGWSRRSRRQTSRKLLGQA